MSLLEVRCNKCGRLLQADPNSTEPLVCTHCQNEIPRSGAFPRPRAAARPMPRVMVAGGPAAPAAVAAQAVRAGPGGPVGQAQPRPLGAPAAGGSQGMAADPSGAAGVEEEPSALQAAFVEAFPWALSVAFHLGVLLLLTFFTTFASPSVKGKGPGEEDFVPPEEQKIPTHLLGDSDTPGAKVVTDFEGIEAFGKGKDTRDFTSSGSELADAGTEKGGKDNDYADLGISVPGGVGGSGGTGDGTGVGSAGLGKGLSNAGGRGGKFFGTGLPRNGVMKIVYMIDASGSMNATLDYVKAELRHSISELQVRQQFQVLLFNEGAPKEFTFKGKAGFQNATPDAKKAVYEWIDPKIAMSETGQTLPQDTFKKAFAIQPELIYVLTDGLFDGGDVPAFVAGLNKDKKVMINTILFREHNVAGEAQLKKIAKENGGLYTFIDEKNLGKEYK